MDLKTVAKTVKVSFVVRRNFSAAAITPSMKSLEENHLKIHSGRLERSRLQRNCAPESGFQENYNTIGIWLGGRIPVGKT